MAGTRSRLLFALYPLFFLSGASSLIFENLWQRKMIHVFGASAPSITAILTAFFCGMAFGSWWGGRLLTRFEHRVSPLRFYALTEAWIGVFGISVPLLLRGVGALYLPLFSSHAPDPALSFVYRFAMCVAVALPASLGMGATVPVMSRLISDYGIGVGRSVGLAYGVNTLGAVLGCLATGFVLLGALGIQDSLFFASGLNAVVVIASFALSRREAAVAPAASRPAAWSGAASSSWVGELDFRGALVVAMYFLTSFVAIGLEVTWMRMIAIFTSNGLTTFTVALSVYLTGFSLGSLALYPFLERRLTGLHVFFVSAVGVAVCCLVLMPNAQETTNWLWTHWESDTGVTGMVWATAYEIANAASLMFLPCVFMGLAFPAVCQALTGDRQRIALSSGFLYFVGNLGSMFGAFATGLLLVPALSMNGVWGLFVAVLCVLGAVVLELSGVRRRRALQLACLALCAPALYYGSDDTPYVHLGKLVRVEGGWKLFGPAGQPSRTTLISNRTGASATVSVHETTDPNGGPPDRTIFIDDQPVAATGLFSKVDSKMLAHIPLLLHPHPESALTVGFGSGGTSWSMTLHGVRTDVAEIEPEVVRSASLFEMQNHGVLRSPLLHVVLNDARNYLFTTRKRYDVISTDVTNLQYKQNGSLYSREYFALMKSRLTEDGVACAWIPISIPDADFATLLATWQTVFPHASLWFMDQTKTTFAILIGTPGPTTFDYARLQEAFANEAVREDLARIHIFHPFHLIHFMYLDEAGYREFTGDDVPLHTDDHPILEIKGLTTYYGSPDSVARRVQRLWALRPANLESRVVNLDEEDRELFRRYARFSRAWGSLTNFEQFNASRRGEPEYYQQALKLLEEAVDANPDYTPARRKLHRYRERLASLPTT